MKKFLVPASLLSVAALVVVACTQDISTAPGRQSVRGLSSDIGIAEAAEIQVCVAGPVGPDYTVDISLTDDKDTDITITGNGLAITAGNCIVADQKNFGIEVEDAYPQYCLKPIHQNPTLHIYCPAIATTTAHASVAGTWTYSCVTPLESPHFCPGSGDYDAFTPAPNGSGNTAVTKGNVYHGSTITYTFVPNTETPCPAGSFTYSMVNGDLTIKYDQFPAPNDNSYGVNAVGWGSKGHTFGDLTGSDKAGIQLKDQNGVVKLSFNVDYLSAKSTAPSGYASLGVTGGDGGMLVGSADGITATTSLANNLNNINIPGLFNPATHAQLIGSVNVLVNSPPVAPGTYNITDPALANWDFHDTYYVTVSAAKLAGLGFNPATWTVEPNLNVLHNSPAKACPTTDAPCQLTTTKWEVKDKNVKVTVANGANAAVYLTEAALTWPSATNGKLMKIKLDGDVVWSATNNSGSVALALADLVADQNKRKLDKNSSDVITFEFEKNADKDLSKYSSTFKFGNCEIALLPH